MTPQAQLALLLLLPTVLLLFKRFSTDRAVVISFILAWLFLPQRAVFSFPGLPDYDRATATSYSIMLATYLYHPQRFRTFKFGWLDIPMLMWCISPFMASITNDLGAYDGFSSMLTQIVEYGIPYFLGRLYLNSLKGLQELAMGIFISGIIYAPLCWLESVISPQLHRMVYGYHGIHQFSQSYRLGGYRPNVFMKHGLSVGMWMMAATLIALWLWQSGTLKKFLNIPMMFWFIGLYITHLIVRSTGAYMYMFFGVVILFCAKLCRTAFPLLLLILMLSSYLYLGVTGNFTGKQADQIIEVATQMAGAERAASLEFRFDNEELLVVKAKQRMWFGWGGWGRNRIYAYSESEGKLKDISVTDSLWIIAYGINGAFGVIGIFGTSLIPPLMFSLFQYPAKTWFRRPQVAGAAVLSVVIVLYVLDNLLNDQYNPVFTLASGGLAGLLMNPNPQEFNSSVAGSSHTINSQGTENQKIPATPLLMTTKTVKSIPKVNPRKSRPIPISAKPSVSLLKLNRRKSRPIPISAKPSVSLLKLNRRKS
ncbi:O-antigen ligase domain-containing protein [Planktothrix mougeotii]|uniref:O-antigen ligase domain-containing protein n=1 Tax=Planktothrix mougeotii LEGE 06226 TaxID=1828728 RepID=A0ABR9UEF5_9CYAN|nr:O-antigen ligase domain-containing protein [Planktothrix mougeotii]MBE9144850.1 O-antigen ligase domain-containing protein [Planktothrix mougeotii LEGE 06226]